MSNALVGLVMDFVVLLALGGAVFYMTRLMRSLQNFRHHREELKGIIFELTKNVQAAERAMEGLKEASHGAVTNLEEILYDSRKMREELKSINQVSDALAGRLEKLAEQSRKAAPTPPSFAPGVEREPSRPARAAHVDTPSFAIRDPDYGAEDEQGGQDEWEDDTQMFASQAEKDLYEALRRNKARTTGGGGA